MIALSAALVLIVALYLVDKNRVWRQAFKVLASAALLGVLSLAGLYGWDRYAGWKEIKREKLLEDRVNACVLRSSSYKNPEPNGWKVAAKETCRENPDTDWTIDYDALAKQNGGASPDWFEKNAPNPVVEIRGGETLKVIPSKPKPGGVFENAATVPIIYLGHHQTITVSCGNFGEKPNLARSNESGDIVCP